MNRPLDADGSELNPHGAAAKPGSPEGLRRIVFYSLLGGAAALVPIPLVDDWTFSWVRRRMCFELLKGSGGSADKKALQVLAGERDRFEGGACLYKVFFAVVVVPIRVLGALLRGIFRKILFFLAVKQAADWASLAFHEGYLLRHALLSLETEPGISEARARHLRDRIRRSLVGTNRSPVWGVFAGIFRMHRSLLQRAAAILSRVWRHRGNLGAEPVEKAEPELREERSLLDALVGRVMDVLGGEEQYLKSLERRYDDAGGHGPAAA